MRLLLPALACGCLVAATALHSQIVFSFDDGSLIPENDYDPITIGNAETESHFNSFTNSTGWDSALQVSGANGFFSTPQNQATAGDAFFFSIDVASGYVFTVSEISFQVRGTGGSPQQVGFSLGSLSHNFGALFSNDSEIKTLSQSSLSIQLTGADRFAIQGWGSSGASALQLDNIRITGSLTAIPEPSTYAAILGAVALGIVFYQRRKSRYTMQNNPTKLP